MQHVHPSINIVRVLISVLFRRWQPTQCNPLSLLSFCVSCVSVNWWSSAKC